MTDSDRIGKSLSPIMWRLIRTLRWSYGLLVWGTERSVLLTNPPEPLRGLIFRPKPETVQ